MTIKDILNKDITLISRMNAKELRKSVQQLASAANKRITRLEKSNVPSQALTNVKQGGGKFSTKGKNINELRYEFARVKKFLNAKTSTIKGSKSVLKDVEKRIGKKLDIGQQKKFWEVYNKLLELNPSIENFSSSTQMQQFIAEELDDYNVDELLKLANERVGKDYEEIQRNEYDFFANFFNGNPFNF